MTIDTLYCQGSVWRDGIDRLCGQSVGVVTWTDHTGKAHAACSRHAGSLKRRYPSELPPRTAPAGTLGLGSPWARGAFAPDDVVAVENAIPAGYRINVLAMNPRRFVVVGLRDRDELFRTPPTGSPFQAAQAMCERLALHAEPYVTRRLNAMRCSVCGHRLDDMGGCDSCAGDRDAAGE